jgi:hypothetical protein
MTSNVLEMKNVLLHVKLLEQSVKPIVLLVMQNVKPYVQSVKRIAAKPIQQLMVDIVHTMIIVRVTINTMVEIQSRHHLPHL